MRAAQKPNPRLRPRRAPAACVVRLLSVAGSQSEAPWRSCGPARRFSTGQDGHCLPAKGALRRDLHKGLHPASRPGRRTKPAPDPLAAWGESTQSQPLSVPTWAWASPRDPRQILGLGHACCSPARGAGSPSPRPGAAPGSPPVSWEKGFRAACGRGTLNALGRCWVLGRHIPSRGASPGPERSELQRSSRSDW